MSSFSKSSFLNESAGLTKSSGHQHIYIENLHTSKSNVKCGHTPLKCIFPRTAIDLKEISEKCKRTYVRDINHSGAYYSKKKKDLKTT